MHSSVLILVKKPKKRLAESKRRHLFFKCSVAKTIHAYSVHTDFWQGNHQICKVGQDRIYTPYMTVCLIKSLQNMPYIHRIYMVLASPTNMPRYTLCIYGSGQPYSNGSAGEQQHCTPRKTLWHRIQISVPLHFNAFTLQTQKEDHLCVIQFHSAPSPFQLHENSVRNLDPSFNTLNSKWSACV